MKTLVACFVVLPLLIVSEIQSFDFVVEEDSEKLAERFDLETRGFILNPQLRRGRFQRSTSDSEDEEKLLLGDDKIILHSYKIQSTITSRMANTMVQTIVENRAKHSQNLVFDVQIPKEAFIHNFTMNVNGITFTSSIKEKSAARSQYAKAKAKGKAAAILRSNAFDMENFKAELNVPSGTKVQFEIHYQESIRRKLSTYEHIIPVQPGRLAKHLEVNVHIIEPQGISFVHVPNIFGEQFTDATTVNTGEKKAHVSFKPSLAQQRKCSNCTTTAVEGNLVLTYDVNRDTKAGELEIFNGYFVHYFAPDNLDPLPKNILFVIDVSGSMWGIKMKQTVEAMKTILGDLRSDDQFSILDFNHNVRCWRDSLVQASKIQTDAAKKYIEGIHPNGGTNINDALLRAMFILNEANALGMLDPSSVSMIILVSDGDPTVGELKLPTIQKNVKKHNRDDISLFCLGIGFDVDYDFLKRLATENNGAAQRIFGNQETSSQMKKFYNQVSTPLLKKLDFNYPEGLVSDVTQSTFQHYFGGSEIVVSGKVDTEKVQHLQSMVTATASNAQLILETLADVEGLDEFLYKDKHADPKFTEKLWAYLTVNQLMAERNVALSAAAKRNITKAILQMSLDHHIVTPYTAMLIESPDGDELMLADSPQDRKRACCPGALTIGQPKPEKPIPAWHGSKDTQSALMGPTAAAVHTGSIVIGQAPTDNSIPSWAKPTKKSGGPLPAIMGPTSAIDAGSLIFGHHKPGNSSILSKNPDDTKSIHSVDNDPHFIISLPRQQKDICFNIDSQPGAILNLISDVESRITINGKLIGAKRFLHNKLNTYFGKIGFNFEAKGLKVEVSPEAITLKDGSSTTSLSWSETGSLIRRRLLVSIKKESNVTLTLDGDLTFMVLLHRVWKKHPVNVDFLGIYIPPANNFSSSVHGLIGQFMQEPDVVIYNERPGQDPGKSDATMEVKGHKLTVTRGLQKDYRSDRVFGTNVQCWFIHNNGKGFLDGHYRDYLVPNLYSYLKRI
ncbi:inter-alpha-trypsin inhibitor heavy chain H2 isoform X1 [Ahaetulla prasina]|uniref:inter-alpha-trypsin inhibitor heavy chain H2 isoform X1 n=2 Tax=Ahaetulla prasina TaxID=499056 RepID=UPI002647C50F|nr:inter-alpha-trypsin inhibitor heavy chain H2 isoform X1 [Ahaetulla prasina]